MSESADDGFYPSPRTRRGWFLEGLDAVRGATCMLLRMKVAVNGARGKMGATVVKYIEAQVGWTVAGKIGRGDDLQAQLEQHRPDVLVEFSGAGSRMAPIECALKAGVRVVVGTSGYTAEDLKVIGDWVEKAGLGCIIAPNFQVGNVLMQQFAAQAARYFEYAEVIEYHHEHKRDYPSGTAMRTVEEMAKARPAFNEGTQDEVSSLDGARGGDFAGIRVHAVRMPGYIASQEVLLGAPGQRLSIRHDSIDRESYMPGVGLAIRHVMEHAGLIYGLEHIL